MVRVHVSMNFKDEATEFGLIGLNNPLICRKMFWSWCNLYKTVKQFSNTKVIECTAKKYRGYFCFQIIIDIEVGIDPFNQFKVFAGALAGASWAPTYPRRGSRGRADLDGDVGAGRDDEGDG